MAEPTQPPQTVEEVVALVSQAFGPVELVSTEQPGAFEQAARQTYKACLAECLEHPEDGIQSRALRLALRTAGGIIGEKACAEVGAEVAKELGRDRA